MRTLNINAATAAARLVSEHMTVAYYTHDETQRWSHLELARRHLATLNEAFTADAVDAEADKIPCAACGLWNHGVSECAQYGREPEPRPVVDGLKSSPRGYEPIGYREDLAATDQAHLVTGR